MPDDPDMPPSAAPWRPPVNPFWMGPGWVPPLDRTQLISQWEQAGEYLATVLSGCLAAYRNRLVRNGFTNDTITQLLIEYQHTWLRKFLDDGQSSADPHWPDQAGVDDPDDDPEIGGGCE